MVKVKINVSGTVFEVDSNLFEKVHSDKKLVGKLPSIVLKPDNDGKVLEVQRSAVSFAAILEFYQTGELHMPTDVCPASFKKELDFWEIGVPVMEICCRTKYLSFVEEQSLLKEFRQDIEKYANPLSSKQDSALGNRVWQIVDNQSTSPLARIYFGITILAVLASITSISLGTHRRFMREASFCELMEYLEATDPALHEAILKSSGVEECLEPVSFMSHDQTVMPRDIIHNEDDFDYYIKIYPSENDSKKRHPDIVTVPKLYLKKGNLEMIEYVTLGFFTFDIFLRILSCPSLRKFMRSFLNIIDIAALIGSYTLIFVTLCFVEQKYKTNWLDLLGFIQVFRALRLFRVVKQIRTSRVLSFSVRRNIKELFVLILFLLICICIFGTLIYFAEGGVEIRSIPDGFWWSVVTITTVGYGDVIPQTLIGRIIGSLCAVTGIWLMSMTLPILINNFILLYKYPTQTMEIKDGQDKDLIEKGDTLK